MKVSRLVERPVLSNPKDILVNSILEAAEDHYKGKSYKQELRDPYYTALACQSQQSLSISYVSSNGLEKDSLNGKY
jgi:hypothetical protein